MAMPKTTLPRRGQSQESDSVASVGQLWRGVVLDLLLLFP